MEVVYPIEITQEEYDRLIARLKALEAEHKAALVLIANAGIEDVEWLTAADTWMSLVTEADRLRSKDGATRPHESWCIGGERGPCNCGAVPIRSERK